MALFLNWLFASRICLSVLDPALESSESDLRGTSFPAANLKNRQSGEGREYRLLATTNQSQQLWPR
jgi:hypothetical protein